MNMSTDPIHSRRLRPLMPRPLTSCTTPYSLQNPSTHSWNILALSGLSECGVKREMTGGPPLVSSRWNPTAEQVQALEEMYRQGTKTPSAEEIQQIVAKLRRFGKIEGKNVFYWFQNHKARDRQKKRRQMELFAGGDDRDIEIQRSKRSGSSRRYLENGLSKKLPTMSNCSTAPKYSESMHGATVQELQEKITNDQKGPAQKNAFAALNLCKLLTPKNNHFRSIEGGIREKELFPLWGNDLSTAEEETNDDSRWVPNQFYEFLPTKN